MPINNPQGTVVAYTVDELVDIIEANEYGPEITTDMAERLVDLASRRTQARADSAFEEVDRDYLLMTTWDNFCRDTFGSASGVLNRFALCVPNVEVSRRKNAWLCERAVAVQQPWLETGDGRCTQIEQIDQTHTDFHDEVGKMWAMKDYTALVTFGDGLVRRTPKIEEAM